MSTSVLHYPPSSRSGTTLARTRSLRNEEAELEVFYCGSVARSDSAAWPQRLRAAVRSGRDLLCRRFVRAVQHDGPGRGNQCLRRLRPLPEVPLGAKKTLARQQPPPPPFPPE